MSYSWGAADRHFLINIIYISFVRKTSPWFKSYFNGHQAASKRHIGTRAKQQFSLFSLCFSTQWKASSHMLYWLSVTSFCDVAYHCPLAINLNVFRAPFEMGSSSTPFSSFSPILRPDANSFSPLVHSLWKGPRPPLPCFSHCFTSLSVSLRLVLTMTPKAISAPAPHCTWSRPVFHLCW